MNRFVVAAAVLVLVGCSQGDSASARSGWSPEHLLGQLSGNASERGTAVKGGDPVGQTSRSLATGGQATPDQAVVKRRSASFAGLADKGELLVYRDNRGGRVDGAYTWHRADVSEDHAMRAIAEGRMRLRTPSGQGLDIVYDHHIEHPNGDLSWVGHLAGHQGAQTILTFGADAVYGVIGQANNRSLRLTTRDRAAWIVETDPDRLRGLASTAANPKQSDFLVARKSPFAQGAPFLSQAAVEAIAAQKATAAAAANTTIDVLIGYTQGLSSAQPRGSSAATRLNQMVAVGNEALANSQASVRIRLVATMQVSYADATDNGDALEKLTGYDSGADKYTTPDPAFKSLRAARETYGADLVVLVRQFRDPEQNGCGIAWLIGNGKTPPTAGDGSDYFGYAVVSDGDDVNERDGETYHCRDETLIHELGHNMGLQHDRETAKGDDGVLDAWDYGAYPYSFGYRTSASAGNFFTVMAYGDNGQTEYRVFSNPRITLCGGYACGTASYEDNARSLSQIAPVIAAFRATKTSTGLNLYAVKKNGVSSTEVHGLSSAGAYHSFNLHVATALGKTGSDDSWTFSLGDYNRDGKSDLIGVKKAASKVEVHILSGESNYSSFLLRSVVPLAGTGSSPQWEYEVGDYNRDGVPDLFAINKNSSSGRTDIHVLSGASEFQTFLLHSASGLGATGSSHAWKFGIGYYDSDATPDVFAIKKYGGSKMEVHVLAGSSGYGTFLLRAVAPYGGLSSAANSHDVEIGDYNGDGKSDVFLVKKYPSQATEVHILSGAANYQQYLSRTATALGQAGSDSSWEFGLVPN